MGVFYKKVTLINPENKTNSITVDMIVDSGATYTQLPASKLEHLGIKRLSKRKFKIATGEIIERDIGITEIQIDNEIYPTIVVFGDEASEPLLGSVTLEEFGLGIDPINKKLVPVVQFLLTAKRTVIPIGPYHPLQEEAAFFKLSVEGEKVTELEIEIGYNHRGIEKLSESKHYDQIPFLVERICGICSTSHPFAYVNAVEDLLGIDIPLRAKYIRTIIAELERLHSHLLWLGLAGHFLGYNTVWMWAWKYREPVLDILELITGNRQNYAMFKIGGVRKDIANEDLPKIWKMCDDLIPIVDMFKGAVMDDPVIHARTKGVGVLTKQEAIDYCVVGPTARASGVNIDVRRDSPYAAYPLVDWKVIVLQNGDVFDKLAVRILEMYESIKIIKGCLEKIKKEPEGEIEIQIKDIPPGEGIGLHEAPRGEVFHYIRSDGTNRPIRHKIRAPSYVNIPSNQVAAVKGTISDAAITLAAVDPCYSCTERCIVIDKKTPHKKLTWEDLIKLSQEKTKEIRRNFK